MSNSETPPAAAERFSKKVLAVIAALTAILVALAGLKAAWVQLAGPTQVGGDGAAPTGDPTSSAIEAHGMNCPKPLDQTQAEVAAHARGRLAAKGLMDGRADASVVTTTTRNLFAEYPNADRVAVAQAVLSATCELIKTSRLSDQEKIDMLLRTNEQVTSLVD